MVMLCKRFTMKTTKILQVGTSVIEVGNILGFINYVSPVLIKHLRKHTEYPVKFGIFPPFIHPTSFGVAYDKEGVRPFVHEGGPFKGQRTTLWLGFNADITSEEYRSYYRLLEFSPFGVDETNINLLIYRDLSKIFKYQHIHKKSHLTVSNKTREDDFIY